MQKYIKGLMIQFGIIGTGLGIKRNPDKSITKRRSLELRQSFRPAAGVSPAVLVMYDLIICEDHSEIIDTVEIIFNSGRGQKYAQHISVPKLVVGLPKYVQTGTRRFY